MTVAVRLTGCALLLYVLLGGAYAVMFPAVLMMTLPLDFAPPSPPGPLPMDPTSRYLRGELDTIDYILLMDGDTRP